MNKAHQRSIQMSRTSGQTARQNFQQIQNIRQANQASMDRATAIGVHQTSNDRSAGAGSKKVGGFGAFIGACIFGAWLGGLGFLFGGPILAVISGMIGLKLGAKVG